MSLELISKQPRSQARSSPVLFVHGAWHGAWCWAEHFLDYFAQRGYGAHALSLRGHGGSAGHERLRWTRLADYVADIAQVVNRLPSPPVLIGHSLGGGVVQKYLETETLPAGVLLASMPPAGTLGATLRFARRHPLRMIQTNLTFSLYPLINTPQLTHEAFFSASMPEDLVEQYFARMQDEAYRAFLDMLALNLPRPKRVRTPMLVMGAADDMIFSPNEVVATARAYRTDAIIFPDMGHDMMLDTNWQAVADRILDWLDERVV